MSGARALYLYAVVAEEVRLGVVCGIGGEPVQIVAAAQLGVVASDVDVAWLAEVNAATDGASLGALARCHDAVVCEAVAVASGLLPFRLGTVLPDREAARRYLAARADVLRPSLSHVEACREWGVIVHEDTRRASGVANKRSPAESKGHDAPGAGAAYLVRRRLELARAQERSRTRTRAWARTLPTSCGRRRSMRRRGAFVETPCSSARTISCDARRNLPSSTPWTAAGISSPNAAFSSSSAVPGRRTRSPPIFSWRWTVDDANLESRRMATTGLVDLLDRVIGGGLVVTGDVVIALAGVDLLYLDLKLLLAPAERLLSSAGGETRRRMDPTMTNAGGEGELYASTWMRKTWVVAWGPWSLGSWTSSASCSSVRLCVASTRIR